jgi:hypothetical protein
MQIPDLAVVCAWCRKIITAAPSGSAITHTICPDCLEWAMMHPRDIPPESHGGYDDRRDVWDNV